MDKPKRTSKKNPTKSRHQPKPQSETPPSSPRKSRQARPKAPQDFMEIGGSPAPGLTLRRVLRHTAVINRIAWSPDGRLLASPSEDSTIRIWDVERGKSLSVLKGHKASVIRVVWSPDGRVLVSSSADATIRFWDVEARKSFRVFKAHELLIGSISWAKHKGLLASGSQDRNIKIWDIETGELCRTLEGHKDYVNDVAWSPDEDMLASASADSTVHIWETETGKILQRLHHPSVVGMVLWSPLDQRTLFSVSVDSSIYVWRLNREKPFSLIQGHDDIVGCVSMSADSRLLASKSYDNTFRIWDCKTWDMLTTVSEQTVGLAQPWADICFSPTSPVLATFGQGNQIIRIWDVDASTLLGGRAATESVTYTTAKIVLVGDSGVGKTGLGWRLAHGEFKEHESTHGQQFWVIEELKTRRRDGTECEAVLWDLAGQHVYRAVHAIFLDDVDLSLVLFDPTNRQEPLKGAEFWLEQLAGKGELPPSVLVGARADRGAAVMSGEELEQFCQRYGISGGYIGTSAKSGLNVDRLLEVIKAQIPWERMTTTVTTVTFKRIKEYVLSLKEKADRRGVLVRPSELRGQLEASDEEWEFTDAEMMTAVRHLANHGYVAVLRGSSGEEFVLLTPELLVDLAASVVLQADKHPRELGAVNETELLKGVHSFAELATLEEAERQILLDAAVERFLSHNICFRETLGADALLIFPGLIKQKRPLLDEVEATEDVSYIVRVENVYAALVVLLGYTRTFTRVNQWQNQAQYQMGEGEICGFRLIEEREGEIELVLYYSAAMPAHGRRMFQGLFEQFLYQRDVEVTRFPPVVCPGGHLQQRTTVINSLREGWESIFCAKCGKEIMPPEIERPLVLGARDASRVRREEALARLRSTYETHLVRVKGFRRDRAAPRCFLSHAPEQAEWASRLARDLREAGVFLPEERAQAQADDFVIVVGTPAYKRAWDAPAAALAADADLVRARLRQVSASRPTVIPLLLEGAAGAALPRELLHDCVPGDFREDTQYAVSLFDLVLTLYAIPLNRPGFESLREDLRRQWEETLGRLASLSDEMGKEVYISYAWGGESEKIADELDAAFRSRDVTVVRDRRDLGFKGRIKEFMEEIGRGRCVILVVSEKYLKSENCLFELLQVMKHGDFADRVFPVVLDDARIYRPVDRIRYVRHWENQLKELDDEMKTVSAANMQGFREDIDLYAEIRAHLPRLADILKDMNALTPKTHRASGFAELYDAVMARLAG